MALHLSLTDLCDNWYSTLVRVRYPSVFRFVPEPYNPFFKIQALLRGSIFRNLLWVIHLPYLITLTLASCFNILLVISTSPAVCSPLTNDMQATTTASRDDTAYPFCPQLHAAGYPVNKTCQQQLVIWLGLCIVMLCQCVSSYNSSTYCS